MTDVRRRSFIAALLASALGGCASRAELAELRGDFAVEHVTVLSMAPGWTPMPDATVIVRDGRIVEVAPSDSVRLISDVTRIDGRGRHLMPGLADMHVHALNRGYGRMLPGGAAFPADYMRTEDVMLAFIANGVTQILEMSALPETLEQRAEIEAGTALGPHIAAAAMVDGDPPVWPLNARVATTPEAGRRAVREIVAAGFEFVKIYSRLEIPVFEAVVDEAKLAGVGVVGHVPAGSRGHADQVLIPGLSMVAHAEEFSKLDQEASDQDIERYARLARAGGVWMTTTLTTNEWIARQTRDPSLVTSARGVEYVHPVLIGQWTHANRYAANFSEDLARRREALVPFTQRLVRRFSEAGVPLVSGTDSIVPGVVYGFSLHDDLELMATAGLSNRQVLESATRLPAEFLNAVEDRGTIRVGRAADFIVLDADPLQSISNTRSIAAVVIGGRYLARTELDAMLADLARRYSEMPRR